MNKQLYWCDVCSVNLVDCEGNEGKEYYSCYSAQAWLKHIRSAKHKKQVEYHNNLTDEDSGIKCKYCSKTFTAEGYALHEERNKSLWDCYKTTEIAKMTCNNFFVGKKRYESVEEYKASKNKPKQKRVKVGSFSPVTQTTRQPNTKGGRKKQSITIISDSDEEDTTEQDLLEIEQLKKQYYIDKARKKEQQDKEEAKEKKKLDNNPSLKRLMESVDNIEIKPGVKLTIEEIDYTERPHFDEYCDDCGLPINYDVPKNILNKWEIDTCCCEETDSDEDI
jgi:hypothetical protein